ncbi:MAG: hypothetical protein QM754_20120 [Tepidisphaeraceae bacterium]
MLGYRLGFVLAAVIALLFGLVFREIAALNALTPPTALLTSAAATEPLTTEVPASAVFTSDESGDARVLYQQAIDAVRRDPNRYSNLLAERDADAILQSPGVNALLAARSRRGDALAEPQNRATYDSVSDDHDTLLLAGRCAQRAALLLADARPTEARQAFEAAFALGVRLFDGRIRADEAVAGLAMARDAAAGLRQLAEKAGDPRRAALLATFDRSAAALERQRLQPVIDAVCAIDNIVIARHAGDARRLAEKSTAERMWRIEAILTLGRQRYTLDRDADRLAVPRLLRELQQNETDEVVLAALHAAERLTVENFRTLR